MYTIGELIDGARVLLQDTKQPYRWPEEQFRMALQLAYDEAYRIRPDLYIRLETPNPLTAPLDTSAAIPRGYASAFLYYISGHIQLSDSEDTQDGRATIFLNKFVAQMTTTQS